MRSHLAAISLLAFSIATFSHAANAYQVPVGCVTPSAPKHIFYVDPVKGSNSGDGSAAHPWHTLAEVIGAGLVGFQTHHEPYAADAPLLPVNPKAVVHAGDAIYLLSGNHGSIYLRDAFNSDYITIKAAPGATPVVNQITVGSGSNWIFDGLTVEGIHSTTVPNYLVFVSANVWTGPVSNIIVNGNTIQSQADTTGWSKADWLSKRANGIQFSTAMNSNDLNDGQCLTATNNTIRNVGFALYTGFGNNVLIDHNTIDRFSDDAIDYLSNNLMISNNTITNSIEDGDLIHRDAMQGQNYYSENDYHHDITIQDNTIINQTDPKLQFPAQLQGIDAFDGLWENVLIQNNAIITNSAQGIAYQGAKNLTIINNTLLADAFGAAGYVAQPNTDAIVNSYATQIYVNTSRIGAASNIIIRNNISDCFSVGSEGIIADHNLIATGTSKYWDPFPAGTAAVPHASPVDIFVAFDPEKYNYNLHLKTGSPAIGTGSNAWAPATDITGQLRTTPIDMGAYLYPRTPAVVTTPAAQTPNKTALGSSTPTTTSQSYNGTIYITGNARQIPGSPSPQIEVLVDGQVVGAAAVTASMGAGQVGGYSFNFTTPKHPTTVEILMNGYTTKVQNNVSIDLFNIQLINNSRKVELALTPGTILAGNITKYSPTQGAWMFWTNGSALQFNVSND